MSPPRYQKVKEEQEEENKQVKVEVYSSSLV